MESQHSTHDQLSAIEPTETSQPPAEIDGTDTTLLDTFDFSQIDGLEYPSLFPEKDFLLTNDFVLRPTSQGRLIQTPQSPDQKQTSLAPTYSSTVSHLDSILYPSPRTNSRCKSQSSFLPSFVSCQLANLPRYSPPHNIYALCSLN
jgi:hypothetical protein